MTKKTRLIPFDYARYQAGAKAVCRDPQFKVSFLLPRNEDVWCLLLVYKLNESYDSCMLDINGKFNLHETQSEYDLLLEEEIEEKTIYINLYSGNASFKYLSLERAIEHKDADCLGTLKVTYTDEDFIK